MVVIKTGTQVDRSVYLYLKNLSVSPNLNGGVSLCTSEPVYQELVYLYLKNLFVSITRNCSDSSVHLNSPFVFPHIYCELVYLYQKYLFVSPNHNPLCTPEPEEAPSSTVNLCTCTLYIVTVHVHCMHTLCTVTSLPLRCTQDGSLNI